MKIILEFNLPEEREAYEDAVNGSKYKDMLDQVWEKLFRPRHKHGYRNEVLNELINYSNEANAAMDILEDIYKSEILNEDLE